MSQRKLRFRGGGGTGFIRFFLRGWGALATAAIFRPAANVQGAIFLMVKDGSREPASALLYTT